MQTEPPKVTRQHDSTVKGGVTRADALVFS